MSSAQKQRSGGGALGRNGVRHCHLNKRHTRLPSPMQRQSTEADLSTRIEDAIVLLRVTSPSRDFFAARMSYIQPYVEFHYISDISYINYDDAPLLAFR